VPNYSKRKIKLAAQLTEGLVKRSAKGLATLLQELRRWLQRAKLSKINVQLLAQLQNPESQAVYASYIVRFVCFYLQVLGDKDQQIIRIQQQQDTAALSKSSAASSSKENSKDNRNKGSKANNNSPQPQHRARSQQALDIIKNARELFT
jgi:hypothetical protein